MRRLEERAAEALTRTGEVAVPLPELAEAVCVDGLGPRVDASELLAAVRRAPRRFRVLDPGRGPWSSCDLAGDAAAYGSRLRALGLHADPWIVTLSPPTERGWGRSRPAGEETAATLACLAQALDEASPREVNRWLRLVHEDRRRRRRLDDPPGDGEPAAPERRTR